MINLDPLSIFITVLYVTILYVFLNKVFFKPILAVLRERRNLIAGRLESAQRKISEADAKAAGYEQAIRAARAETYRRQEASREEAMGARAAIVAKTRSETESTIRAAKAKLQADALVAK